MVLGDANAKVGKQVVCKEGTVGKYEAPSERNDNGERCVSVCALNNLTKTLTMFHTSKSTSIHKHHQMAYIRMIDHVTIHRKMSQQRQMLEAITISLSSKLS
jgi:hypothetical protein